MYETTFVYTLPDPSVAFYQLSPTFIEYIASNYASKQVSQERTISEDGLSYTTTTVWSTKQDYLDYCADEFVRANQRQRWMHNNENSIQVQSSFREI